MAACLPLGGQVEYSWVFCIQASEQDGAARTQSSPEEAAGDFVTQGLLSLKNFISQAST